VLAILAPSVLRISLLRLRRREGGASPKANKGAREMRSTESRAPKAQVHRISRASHLSSSSPANEGYAPTVQAREKRREAKSSRETRRRTESRARERLALAPSAHEIRCVCRLCSPSAKTREMRRETRHKCKRRSEEERSK